jgi:rod shape-determining protein MreD
MLRSVILFLWLVTAIILQFTVLPAYLDDPFKPNLVIIFVSYLALREDSTYLGGLSAYILGLVHSTFSGINYGLAGITMLLIYLLLKAVADQLYAESANLIIVAVFAATLLDAAVTLLLTVLFTADTTIYNAILRNMFPNAVVTAFAAFLLFSALPLVRRRLFW